MAKTSNTATSASSPGSATAAGRPRRHHAKNPIAGWLFVSPAVIVIGIFLVVPVLMAVWVSVSDWTAVARPSVAT